ncbi:MAG: hypothetical protein AB4372_21090 [Xenococcus sp. (in: cyanobacteria)]
MKKQQKTNRRQKLNYQKLSLQSLSLEQLESLAGGDTGGTTEPAPDPDPIGIHRN